MRPQPVNPLDPPPAANPPRPYEPTGAMLTLPSRLPAAVAALLGADRAEAGALLYGQRGVDGRADTVHAIVVPTQRRHRTHYGIPRESIAAASAATRDHGWVTLAQLHSHPGRNVEHSWYDDRHAISTKALSLVVPYFGADPTDWPDCVGVHAFQQDWWHLLTTDQARARMSLDDLPLTVIDLRSSSHLEQGAR